VTFTKLTLKKVLALLKELFAGERTYTVADKNGIIPNNKINVKITNLFFIF